MGTMAVKPAWISHIDRMHNEKKRQNHGGNKVLVRDHNALQHR
jgi:hypothetical protein